MSERPIPKIHRIVLTLCIGSLMVSAAVEFTKAINEANNFVYLIFTLFMLLSFGSFLFQLRRLKLGLKWGSNSKSFDAIDADFVQDDEPEMENYPFLKLVNTLYCFAASAIFLFAISEMPFNNTSEYVVFSAVGYAAFGTLADILTKQALGRMQKP